MATTYSKILIIYNPTSTGGQAAKKAQRLARRLERSGLRDIEVIGTTHSGHAEELAYATTLQYEQPLLVSVSGDGGYNEVINGAMRAQAKTKHQPVCAIVAAGNANDHRRSVRRRPLWWAITHHTPEAIDVLRITATKGDQKIIRYAHSYIGFGITSEGAAALNQEDLTTWKEIKIALVTLLLNFNVLRIVSKDGQTQALDSLVFANIHRMGKLYKWGRKTNLHNGMFCIAAIPHQRNPLRRMLTAVSIATVGFRNPPQRQAYCFKIPGTELAHLDGEVITIPGGSTITIEAAQEALLTQR